MTLSPAKRYNRPVLWRRHLIPEPLLSHARAVVSLTEGAARFFKSPSDANAFAAAQAKKAAQSAGRRGTNALKALRHAHREDWLVLLRLLSDCSEEAGWAVEETARFETPIDALLVRMGSGLRDACADLGAALSCLSDRARCEGLIVTAKRRALEVERLHRQARFNAHEEANVVLGLKEGAVARRLSQAAEAVQCAADRLSELLAMEAV